MRLKNKGVDMKSSVLLVVLIAAAGLVITSGFTQNNTLPQSVPTLNIKDLPEHGLNIIAPSNPSFDELLTTQLRGRQNAVVEALRPFSILLRNTSKRTVIAFSLKWELMRPDGKILTQTRDYITVWKLTGITGPDKGAHLVRPNSAWVGVPSHITVSQASDSDDNDNAVGTTPELTKYLSDLNKELSQLAGITISLDGAFFDDGTFVGPDNTGFFAKVKSLLDAKRDILIEVKQGLERGKSAHEVFSRIEETAGEPTAEPNSQPSAASHYKKNKKDTAAELLRIRSASGDEKAVEFALTLLRNRWLDLKKL